MAANSLDNITVTKDNLISGTMAILITGGLVACKVYRDQQPELTEIFGASLFAAALAWRVPVSPAGEIIVPQVRITSSLPFSAPEPPAASEREIVTSEPVTTVAVDAPPPAIGHRIVPEMVTPMAGIAAPKRSHHAKSPVVAPIDAHADS